MHVENSWKDCNHSCSLQNYLVELQFLNCFFHLSRCSKVLLKLIDWVSGMMVNYQTEHSGLVYGLEHHIEQGDSRFFPLTMFEYPLFSHLTQSLFSLQFPLQITNFGQGPNQKRCLEWFSVKFKSKIWKMHFYNKIYLTIPKVPLHLSYLVYFSVNTMNFYPILTTISCDYLTTKHLLILLFLLLTGLFWLDRKNNHMNLWKYVLAKRRKYLKMD